MPGYTALLNLKKGLKKMKNRQLFLLNREGRISLLSGISPVVFVSSLKEGNIQGLYGTYPDSKEIDQVKSELYILGEEGGRIGLGDKTFYIRFFLSLLVFLVIFYVLTYLVPDPIPLVDEIAIALTGSILFSFWHRKRVERGDRMVRERINIKGEIDKIEFNESPLLREVEFYLEALDAKSIEGISEIWLDSNLPFHVDDRGGLLPELTRGIEKKLGLKKLKRFKSVMNSVMGQKKQNNKNRQPVNLISNLTQDLPLAVLYWKLMDSLI
jgi:hypothetical protein